MSLYLPLYRKSSQSLLAEITTYIKTKKTCTIVTPNPEIVVEASKNPQLLRVLQHASFVLCDGVGLQLFTHAPLFKGRILFEQLLSLAQKYSLPIYLLCGTKKVLEKSTYKIQKTYTSLTVFGAVGPHLTNEGLPLNATEKEIENAILTEIITCKPALVFVGFGCPKQELWMDRVKTLVPPAGWMTVGGTLDTFSGVKPEPPKLFELLGLEWLFRLLVEPQRIKRIYTALFVFPFIALQTKISASQ